MSGYDSVILLSGLSLITSDEFSWFVHGDVFGPFTLCGAYKEKIEEYLITLHSKDFSDVKDMFAEAEQQYRMYRAQWILMHANTIL